MTGTNNQGMYEVSAVDRHQQQRDAGSLPPGAQLASSASSPAMGAGREDAVQARLPADTLRLPPGMRIDGSMGVSSAVLLEGEFNGTLSAKGLIVVAKGARLCGCITGDGDIIVAGEVFASDGSPVAIHAGGRLMAAETAKIAGNVHYATIAIYEGAAVTGTLVPHSA